jgi:hypothetical protein
MCTSVWLGGKDSFRGARQALAATAPSGVELEGPASIPRTLRMTTPPSGLGEGLHGRRMLPHGHTLAC